ncbi:MAG: hypothetical protein IPO31_24855 [Candidatus Obscuribacter sp.]|nr:hypothetical protein [Candidatus Obscuribacter sp.]
MLATLHIADKPLGYEPPIGPAIGFKFDYNHLQTNQPTTFTFTNVGQNWNFYQRRMKDGSIETYSQSDGSSPARIFLTQVQDPQGNSVFIQYDANFRLTTIYLSADHAVWYDKFLSICPE